MDPYTGKCWEPEYEFDYLIYVGRFQPFHVGHEQAIRSALTLSKRVIVLVGSSYQPRTIKNPWTFEEREEMIKRAFLTPKETDHIIIKPLRDQSYNDQRWVADVQQKVDMIVVGDYFAPHVISPSVIAERLPDLKKNLRIGIIGHIKDESSYYLKMFPQWRLTEHYYYEDINATDIRALYFSKKNPKFIKGIVPSTTFLFLEDFSVTKEFETLKKEYLFIEKYKDAWKTAPYPPTFVTVDAVVVQAGHVLLVRRKSAPGENLLALPGGFVDQNEYLVDAVLRELREETKLKVPAPVLKGSIKAFKVFDNPTRSLRGRTITNAYLIELPAGELPSVKGGDDAAKAGWVPIADIKEQEMFEDHYAIIQYFLGSV